MKSVEHSHITAKEVRPLVLKKKDVSAYKSLSKLGICLDERDIRKMSHANDADLVVPLTTPSITNPIQHLQSWLPGFVEVLTAARKIDTLVGITTQAAWHDEEIVQGVLEHTGEAVPYGDYTNVPLSSWNVNWERRSIVRFEEGMSVGRLEEARGAAQNISVDASKREAAGRALEISRNRVGFFGYNDGLNRTYGLLNDPALPAYVSVPVGGSGFTLWSTKTFLEITADIRTFLSALRIQSQDQIDPSSTPIVLALAMSARDYLSVTTDLGGMSVQEWLTTTYPNVRVESAPELDAANGGDNVAYMYAESLEDGSSDDSRTFVQVVPAKFQTLGVEIRAKNTVEDYTNATAGILTKRPFAVYRATGI